MRKLADRDWLILCQTCGQYSRLHKWLPRRAHFQGEHSLVLNTYLMNDYLLGLFLLHHAGHELLTIPDLTEEFRQTIIHKERFMESHIDALVEERVQQQRDAERQVESYRKEGYHALLMLKKLLEEKIRELEAATPADPNQARIHLGRSLGIEWAKGQIEQLLELPYFEMRRDPGQAN